MADVAQAISNDNIEPDNAPLLRRKTLRPLIVLRTPLCHEQVPFIVCWSQKAGCTAILKWFFYHADLLDTALSYRDDNENFQVHDYENRVFKARRGYRVDLIGQIIAGKPIIKFLRCPYERVFSSYMQLNNVKFLGRRERGQMSRSMQIRQDVLDFLHAQPKDFGHPITFKEYMTWLKEQDPDLLNPHHAPQSVPLDDYVPIKYYRLEDFDVTLSQLEHEFRLKRSVAVRDRFYSKHHNRKDHVSTSETLHFLEQPIPLQQFDKITLPTVTRGLLEKTEFDQTIKELFAKDIGLYSALRPAGLLDRCKASVHNWSGRLRHSSLID